jgi:hypothetical protein
MENLARVRFVMAEEGPTPCFQGFHRGEHGLAGAAVYVTADTLRRIVKWHNKNASAFDAIHNRMETEESMLAFGDPEWLHVAEGSGAVTLAPDGMTPLYMLCTYEPLIVQRFDPNGGQEYAIMKVGVPAGTGHHGAWRNVAPYEGEVTPVGFVVDEQGWREGRTDTPPIGLAPDDAFPHEPTCTAGGDHIGFPCPLPKKPLPACWLWNNGLATVDDAGTLAGYMDGGAEQEAECRFFRKKAQENMAFPDRCEHHSPYTNHDGYSTEDPRCELGLCAICIDNSLATNQPILPALSVSDPTYLNNADYRKRVHDAFAAIGVTYRDEGQIG